MKQIPKPQENEYALYYGKYIDLIPAETNILKALKEEGKTFEASLLAMSEEQLLFRYEKDKWSIKDIVMHVVDCERIFLYRALRFARNDKMSLPFFDENLFAQEANADKLSIKNIIKEYKTQRAATIAFFNNQTQKKLKRTGTASQTAMSVRACAWIIYAHECHHRKVIREKYVKGD